MVPQLAIFNNLSEDVQIPVQEGVRGLRRRRHVARGARETMVRAYDTQPHAYFEVPMQNPLGVIQRQVESHDILKMYVHSKNKRSNKSVKSAA